MLLIDSDLELDFEGIVSSYSLAILYWVKRGHIKHKVFVFIKFTFLKYFNLTFFLIISFHRAFATGVACQQGTLTPPDTLSLWDLHMFYLLRPILFRTCRYFTGLCSSNIPRYFLDFAFSCESPFRLNSMSI